MTRELERKWRKKGAAGVDKHPVTLLEESPFGEVSAGGVGMVRR